MRGWTLVAAVALSCGGCRDIAGLDGLVFDETDGIVLEVTAGLNHTCARREAGSVVCWGNNEHGQLGDGTTTGRLQAGAHVIGVEDAVEVVAGVAHSCARHASGAVSCWGANERGQLADRTRSDRSSAAEVSGITDAVSIAAGMWHTCAGRANGSVTCWGANDWGQLGDGTTVDRSEPTRVASLSDAAEVTAGAQHTCVARRSGSAACWGWNSSYQVGAPSGVGDDGFAADALLPLDVVDGPTDLTDIAAGGQFTCGLRASAMLICWGHSPFISGRPYAQGPSPDYVPGVTDVVQMAAGGFHMCVRTGAAGVLCWGNVPYTLPDPPWSGSPLGDGTILYRDTPVSPAGMTDIVSVASGNAHTCAASSSGWVACWGYNDSGQLGRGTLIGSTVPVFVVGL